MQHMHLSGADMNNTGQDGVIEEEEEEVSRTKGTKQVTVKEIND